MHRSILGLLLVVSGVAAGQTLPAGSLSCAEQGQRWFFSGTRRAGWYSGQYQALGAPPICALADSVKEAWRFVWMPTFHPTVAVTVLVTPAGGSVHAVRLDGAGGYDPGAVAADTTFAVGAEAIGELTELIREAGLWSRDGVAPSANGLDGAQWILEWSNGRYQAHVDRWSPGLGGESHPYRAVGEWFLWISGLADRALVAQY